MPDRVDQIDKGRAFFAAQAWLDAYESFSRADRAAPLGPPDLERLATAAYLLGRGGEFVSALDRAHHGHLAAGEPLRAARCAFWVGMHLALRDDAGPASGWFGRARRLVSRSGAPCVEQGYLMLPEVVRHAGAGDWAAAAATAAAAAEIAERFGDRDLFALAVHEQGHALVRQRQVSQGLALLDEAMVTVTTGELSPIVTGLIYCSVIAYCQELYELQRAQEWTASLNHWCDRQPQLLTFTGECLVHRAEIMQLRGAWSDALVEAERAVHRLAETVSEAIAGHAVYRQAEIHRLRGDLAAAEQAYREASRRGWQPQPGLALLRLAQGDGEAAAAAIRRAVGEATEPLRRAGLLPAYVDIIVAQGDAAAAREACRELEEIATSHRSAMLEAMAATARGTVELAADDPTAALVALRRAGQLWQELNVPYDAARVRVLVGLACRALGDDEATGLELEAARSVFEEVGAAADLARLDDLSGRPRAAGGLTGREVEVLRLVAGGKTNKEIAADLVLSERTVERHVSNIFAKLAVSTRTAAAAYAYEHRLV